MGLTITRKPRDAANCTPRHWPFPYQPGPHVWNPQTGKCIRCSTPKPPDARNDVFTLPESMSKAKKEVGL